MKACNTAEEAWSEWISVQDTAEKVSQVPQLWQDQNLDINVQAAMALR